MSDLKRFVAEEEEFVKKFKETTDDFGKWIEEDARKRGEFMVNVKKPSGVMLAAMTEEDLHDELFNKHAKPFVEEKRRRREAAKKKLAEALLSKQDREFEALNGDFHKKVLDSGSEKRMYEDFSKVRQTLLNNHESERRGMLDFLCKLETDEETFVRDFKGKFDPFKKEKRTDLSFPMFVYYGLFVSGQEYEIEVQIRTVDAMAANVDAILKGEKAEVPKFERLRASLKTFSARAKEYVESYDPAEKSKFIGLDEAMQEYVRDYRAEALEFSYALVHCVEALPMSSYEMKLEREREEQERKLREAAEKLRCLLDEADVAKKLDDSGVYDTKNKEACTKALKESQEKIAQIAKEKKDEMRRNEEELIRAKEALRKKGGSLDFGVEFPTMSSIFKDFHEVQSAVCNAIVGVRAHPDRVDAIVAEVQNIFGLVRDSIAKFDDTLCIKADTEKEFKEYMDYYKQRMRAQLLPQHQSKVFSETFTKKILETVLNLHLAKCEFSHADAPAKTMKLDGATPMTLFPPVVFQTVCVFVEVKIVN